MGNKVTMILRTFNRLEYTIQTIATFIDNTQYSNHELLVFDNMSTDWTRERLTWMKSNVDGWFFNKVRVILSDENHWDWWWMVEAMKYVSEDTVYVWQLDNDILMPKDWIKYMAHILDTTDNNSVSLKRHWEKWELVAKDIKKTEIDWDILEYWLIEKAVANYIIRKEIFEKWIKKLWKNCWWQWKWRLAKDDDLCNWKVVKIINKPCRIIEWREISENEEYYDGSTKKVRAETTPIQLIKYPKSPKTHVKI